MGSFIAAILSSAFFLFLVQPLLAKQVLPWFGGTAAVWSVCLVFYQAVLLGGYLYAHALARFLKPRTQAVVHTALMAASLLTLPVGLEGLARPQPDSTQPALDLLLVLARAVGLPYFVLSATSPLVQHWYTRVAPEGKAYKLFGWSNVACAVALLSFPFGFEPMLALSRLNWIWSFGYGLTLIPIGFAAWRAARVAAVEATVTMRAAIDWRDRLGWLGFSVLGSMLLTGVTSHLCQSVAPIPFLWTVPLLLYLLTFAAVFEREWYRRLWGMPLAGAGLLAMAWALARLPAGQMIGLGVPVFTIGFFFACFYCHGELAMRKPDASRLTEFYILLAAGGALGSLLMAFAAPVLFDTYVEFPALLALTALVILFSVYGKDARVDALAAVMAILVLAPVGGVFMKSMEGRVRAGRNFYGSLRIVEEGAEKGQPARRVMMHGSINHGTQFAGEWSRRPTTYYGPDSGAGLCLREPGPARKVGLIGLGAGTLATYGRPGDQFKFYEINPLVVDMARREFTYLKDSAAKVETAVGDGRLLLAAEPPQQFDVLVVDAFSGDSIPVHLLTRESFELYYRHLKPGGLLALHVSNIYLNLQPVVRALAESTGRRSLAIVNPDNKSQGVSLASWALVGSPADLERFASRHNPQLTSGRKQPWTDDFSTLIAALI